VNGRREVTSRWGSPVVLVALWLVLLLLSLLTRPLLPVDETRYLAVAWEMWRRGEFLVPYLNGAPYSDKPPLFFWLIHAGWRLFGVNEWWPRSVAPLFSLAALWVTTYLAGRLWPEDVMARRLLPWVLFGCIVWTVFYTWVQFDMLLVTFAVLAMTGVVAAAQRRRSGWLLMGLGMGLGGLAKGPVILLHVLPAALLAPAWIDVRPRSWWSWYAGIGASLLLGVLIAFAWVLPAVHAGGGDYRQAILWGQTAERLVSAFAHAHPWWWYFPWLPVLLAPWLLLPWLWRPLLQSLHGPHDAGVRLCLVWLMCTLLLMSLVSGKQLKYMLPVLPPFALLVARVLSRAEQAGMARRPRALAGLLLLSGIFLATAPFMFVSPPWVGLVNPLWGVALIVGTVPLAIMKPLRMVHYPLAVAVLSAAVMAVLYLGVLRIAAPAYDIRAASHVVAAAQAAGQPVASLSNYHGQFDFYGRLARPIAELRPDILPAWFREHPEGRVIAYYPARMSSHSGAVFEQPYRSGRLVIWRACVLAADAALLP
jgi:4-amino-4-deoxy-L-arabinose transferase-like glycosyltransferase